MSSSPTSPKKRPRDTSSPSPSLAHTVIHTPPPASTTSPPSHEQQSQPQSQQSSQSQKPQDDLLTRLPLHDWEPFTQRLTSALQLSAAETARLTDEYHMWNWMYEIWTTSRTESDTRRLGREMATLIRWTRMKEEELERAREDHTKSMFAISSVLGIVPRGLEGGNL